MQQFVNEELLDLQIRHQIGLLRLSNGVVRKIIALLNKVEPDLVRQLETFSPDRSERARKRLEDILDAMREILQEAHKAVEPALRSELYDLADYEATYQQKLLADTVPIKVDVIKPSAEQLLSVVTSQPFQGAVMREWAQKLERDAYDRIRNAIRIGFTEGETIDQLVRRLRGTKANQYKDGILEVNRRDAEAIVRTAVNHTATRAREALYRENDDLISGVRWVSTLDSRTTPVCRARDGKVFKIGEGPRPPAHWNCRSTTVPITKSWRELGIDMDEVPETTRASMNGQVPADLTYGDWLRKQSRETVVDIMGATRAKLFLDGKLPIDAFVNDKGREYTLADLRKRDAAAFKRAGID